jgi:hypothetical protein
VIVQQELYGSLQSGREGIQFERMLRLLSVLLYAWCSYEGNRNMGKGEPHDQLRSIPFDKFVTLVARIWDELCRRGVKRREVVADSEVVRFPCPFTERPGKHGSGRAVYDGKSKPEFITVVLMKLQLEGILPYFHIVLPPGVKNEPEAANHPDTLVGPGIVIANKREFLQGFCPREQEVLTDLEQAIRKLGPSELRALGTHCNGDQTLEVVAWEFDAVEQQGLWSEIIDAISKGGPFGEYAQDILEYMDEACRKTDGNCPVYKQGRGIFLTELQDPELREVFAQIHSEPNEIWQLSDMQKLALRASKARALSQLLVRVSDARNLIADGGRISERNTRYLKEAIEQCACVGIADLPEAWNEVLSGSGLVGDFKRRLIAEIREIGNIRQMSFDA